MTFNNMLRNALVFVGLLACAHAKSTFPAEAEFDFGGHSKTRLVGQSYPDNSFFYY